jgi:hypothetical protein
LCWAPFPAPKPHKAAATPNQNAAAVYLLILPVKYRLYKPVRINASQPV